MDPECRPRTTQTTRATRLEERVAEPDRQHGGRCDGSQHVLGWAAAERPRALGGAGGRSWCACPLRRRQSRNQDGAKNQRTRCKVAHPTAVTGIESAESHAGGQSHQDSAPVLAGLFRLGRERHALALRHAEHRSVAPQRQLAHQRLCGKHGRWGHPALVRPRRLIGRGGAQLGAARGLLYSWCHCQKPPTRKSRPSSVPPARLRLRVSLSHPSACLPVCLSVVQPVCRQFDQGGAPIARAR